MFRSIVEEHSYQQSIARLGGARRLDRVLNALFSGLAYKPEAHPTAGNSGLRVAKVDPFFESTTADFMPAYRLFFFIMADTGCVHLVWLEEIPIDDEIPF